ncbi:MAG: signal peptidase II [Candidatus Omnitrophica bacterium CG11_big_fil_rev_8_21_14_0_20_45_26]|uniref:Lipoprotein signal peptidase n=1 Tax=Candidatus Abzuiibacterium crystallinum TaxID=1974748 RepID=A0A2H0LQ35_9BACT|nr:MAG: signal peptidase II [Candidatus Omnitrophica bacterium CG11_big_fil_rev_8_21_14_0_20_45_26]PIW64189.1 MAG: signal peptidase II [Candidatus Omnitrophica bacterium CG12_big_fil_rev_8_21_14_0_65_45_16]
MSRHRFILIVLTIVFIDQSAKYFAQQALTVGQSLPIIPNILHFTLVQNHGIAFGIFQEHGRLLLAVIGVCVFLFVVYMWTFPPKTNLHFAAYGLILGGAIGNLSDRLYAGHVVDFIDFRVWPVFNLADTFISIGVGLLILEMLIKPKGRTQQKEMQV